MLPLSLLVAFALRLLWALRIPIGDAPDEIRHLRTIAFFAQHGLPTREDILSGTHGFYIATSPLPYAPYVALEWLWPGAPLIAHRLLSVLLGTLLVWLGYRIMQRVRPALALPLAWLMALQPQLCFQSAYVNWDILTIVVATLVIATWADLKNSLRVGACAGLCLLCKPTGFAVLPVLLALFIHAQEPLKNWLIAAATCAAVALPFLLHNNHVLPGDPFGFNTVLGTTASDWEASVPGGWSQLWTSRWLINSFESTWAVFGHLAHKVHNAHYVAFGVLTIVAAIRVARRFDRVHAIALAAVLCSLLLSYATSAMNDFQPYGRYLFPSAVPMFGLYVAGLTGWPLRLLLALCMAITAIPPAS